MMRAFELAKRIGRAVILAEHRDYVFKLLNDREHVHRIGRIAMAISEATSELGVSNQEVTLLYDELIDYGKKLFLEEWMSDLREGDDRDSVFARGCDQFDKTLATHMDGDG